MRAKRDYMTADRGSQGQAFSGSGESNLTTTRFRHARGPPSGHYGLRQRERDQLGLLSPPSGGRLRSFSIGLFRTLSPFPSGTIQTCSPVFMLMAVIREYGGLKSGRFPDIRGDVPLCPSRNCRLLFGSGVGASSENR